MSHDADLPQLDKEHDEWVLKVTGAASLHIPIEQRILAQQIWNAATHAYHNGRRDVRREITQALGIES